MRNLEEWGIVSLRDCSFVKFRAKSVQRSYLFQKVLYLDFTIVYWISYKFTKFCLASFLKWNNTGVFWGTKIVSKIGMCVIKKGGCAMKKLIVILCAFSLAAVLGCATSKSDCPTYVTNPNCKLVSFKAGSEPEGYNGIKWETKLSTLDRMKHTRTDPARGGIEFYVREGDTFKLENGKDKMVQYGFLREKFYVAVVSTKGPEEFNALKDTVFKKFGVGAKPFTNREEYLWVGKNVVMSLKYDENLKFGDYYIRSELLAKKMAQK